MKKVISLFICIILLSGLFCTSIASANSADLLSQLKIMDAKDHSRALSKGEFARAIVNAIGIKTGYVGECCFDDISPEYEYYSDVMNLYDLGILQGDGYGKINADRPITFNQAIKVIISVLGYDEYARYKGGYPAGYLYVAKKVGLLDDVEAMGELWLEESDAVKLIEAALWAPMLDISSITTNEDGSEYIANYTDNIGDTLLHKYRNLKNDIGIVSSVPGRLGETSLVINGKYYNYNDDAREMLGCEVKFFYNYNNDIIAISKTDKNIALEIDYKDIKSIDATGITYYNEKDIEKNVNFDSKTTLVYNDELLTSVVNIAFKDLDGNISLVDNNNDKIYDYVFVEEYKYMIVGSLDKKAKKIFDRNDSENILNLAGYDFYIYDEFGYEIEVDEIPENQLIAYTKGDKRIIIHLCSNVLNGSVEKKLSNNTVVINGKEYKINNYYQQHYPIKIGESATYMLDLQGYIAASENIQDKKIRYGYLLGAHCDMTGFENSCKFKVIDEEGYVGIYELAEKVRVNASDSSSNCLVAYNLVLDEVGSIKHQLIRFGINSKNKINYVEIADTARETDRFNKFASSERANFVKTPALMGGNVHISNDTIAFIVPTDNTASPEEYCVTNAMSYLISYSKYAFDAYRIGSNTPTADVLVIKKKNTLDYANDDKVGIFIEKIRVLDEQGEIAEQVVILGKNGESTFWLDKNVLADDFSEGDVVSFYYDALNKNISILNKLYDCDSQTVVGDSSVGAWDSTVHYQFGYVYKKLDGYAYVSTSLPAYNPDESTMKIYKIANIFYFDSDRKTVNLGNASDVIDYKGTGENIKVFVSSRSAEVEWMYIIGK